MKEHPCKVLYDRYLQSLEKKDGISKNFRRRIGIKETKDGEELEVIILSKQLSKDLVGQREEEEKAWDEIERSLKEYLDCTEKFGVPKPG